MRILITGGCGFIGSNIAIYLKKTNDKNKIYCADNFYRKGSIENKKRLLKKDIVVIKCDIRNEKDLNKIPKFDLLIDCANFCALLIIQNRQIDGPRYMIIGKLSW